jgi:tetratricopeptide (TPR) repeat protein
MTHIARRTWAVCFGAALTIATATCRSERASVEDLYTTRMLGLSYLQRNQLAEAESSFKKLTKLAPDDPLGYANLGLTYLQAGKYSEAEKQLRKAGELDPGNTEVRLALARLYSLTGRVSEARATLEQLRRDSTSNARALYALAELQAQSGDSVSRGYEDRLRDVLAVAPANLAVRLKLVDAFARRGEADSAVRQLEEVRRIPPELPKEARTYLDSSIQLLRTGRIAESRGTLDRFFRLTEVTGPYQAALEDVKWTEGPIAGRPVLSFAPKYFISLHGVRDKAAVDLAKFVDASSDAGFATTASAVGATASERTALAAGDVDGDGTDDLFVSTSSQAAAGADGAKSVAHLYRVQGGFVRDAAERSNVSLPQGAAYATFTDYDNDGWLDLFAIGTEGRGHLFRNRSNGTFEETTAKAGVGDVKGAHKAVFVDLDHDGDLDLVLVANALQAYRNNLDGTFTEATASFGLDAAGGSAGAVRDAVFGDFDGDGRIDLLVTGEGGSSLLHNGSGSAKRFSDVTAASGLATSASSGGGGGGGGGSAAVGDYNNDGFLDLVVVSANGGEPALWLNKGNGTFNRDNRSSSALQPLRSPAGSVATLVDYDNDG